MVVQPAQFVSDLVKNYEDRFSHDAAQIIELRYGYNGSCFFPALRLGCQLYFVIGNDFDTSFMLVVRSCLTWGCMDVFAIVCLN